MRLSITAAVVTAGICLMIVGVSLAASTQVASTGVSLWRGTSKLSDSSNRVVDPGTNVLTALTPENCPGIRDRIIARDALTRTTGTATYRCQVDLRAVVTFIRNPTCPLAPAPQTTTQNCPAGTTGTWDQTATTTIGPAPECAATVTLSPTVPPADRCVPDHAQQWTFCANEYQACRFSGTRRVRYGLNSSWVERDLTAVDGGILCRNSTFGSDPAVGMTKRCELRATGTEPPPPVTGSASLSWTPPTQNSDGTSLTDLAGYYVSYGTSASALPDVIQVPIAGATSYTVSNLAPGTYYFAVRAYTSSGNESANSNVASKTVAQ